MLRKLKTADIFRMSKILHQMGLKINATIDKKDENGKEKVVVKNQYQLGVELLMSVFENIHLAENEVNEFLADMSGMDSKEFSELPIEKTFEIIQEFKNIPGLNGFLEQASQLTN